jgi:hypothetical protein
VRRTGVADWIATEPEISDIDDTVYVNDKSHRLTGGDVLKVTSVHHFCAKFCCDAEGRVGFHEHQPVASLRS